MSFRSTARASCRGCTAPRQVDQRAVVGRRVGRRVRRVEVGRLLRQLRAAVGRHDALRPRLDRRHHAAREDVRLPHLAHPRGPPARGARRRSPPPTAAPPRRSSPPAPPASCAATAAPQRSARATGEIDIFQLRAPLRQPARVLRDRAPRRSRTTSAPTTESTPRERANRANRSASRGVPLRCARENIEHSLWALSLRETPEARE